MNISIYNIIKWKLDSNKTNEEINTIQENANIEEVKDNGNVIVSQSNWCNNCEKFSRNELTQKQIKNYGGNHPFIGYIYLLQPK